MNDEFSVAGCWQGRFDETALRQWAEKLRAQLGGHPVSLGLVFISPDFFPQAEQVLEILRVHARIPLLAGCSSLGLIYNEQELESASGIALGLYSLPGAELKGFRLTQSQLEEADGAAYWRGETGIAPANTNGWLAFIDPFHMDAENWVRQWNEAYAPLPVFGGLAGGNIQDQTTQVYLDGEVFEDGGVAISVGGDVKLTGVISQGCTPIGDTWTLTRVEHNLIRQIANRPAYTVLAETFQKLPLAEQQKARGNLLIGLVVNEYLENFHRGDFLVRNLIGGDPNSGVLAVGAFPRPGQTIQFHRRDAVAASEDLREMLAREKSASVARRSTADAFAAATGAAKIFSAAWAMTPKWCARNLARSALPAFFATAKSGRSAAKTICTISRRRWRCS